MGKPLLNEWNVGSIILENPFYGLRKPKEQKWEFHQLYIYSCCRYVDNFVFSPLSLQTLLSTQRLWHFRDGRLSYSRVSCIVSLVRAQRTGSTRSDRSVDGWPRNEFMRFLFYYWAKPNKFFSNRWLHWQPPAGRNLSSWSRAYPGQQLQPCLPEASWVERSTGHFSNRNIFPIKFTTRSSTWCCSLPPSA